MKSEIRTVLIVVGVASFAVRLVAAIASDGLWTPEVNEYHALGRALLEGRGFAFVHNAVLYRSYAPPMHAWLTAASYLIGGSLVPLMLLQAVAGAAVASAAAAIAVRLFGGWLAGAVPGPWLDCTRDSWCTARRKRIP